MHGGIDEFTKQTEHRLHLGLGLADAHAYAAMRLPLLFLPIAAKRACQKHARRQHPAWVRIASILRAVTIICDEP